VVIADSSPLISAARAAKLGLVRRMYPALVIPPSVYVKIVAKGHGKPGAAEVANATWIKVKNPEDKAAVLELEERFGSGESEAIVLAQELGGVLLADEGSVLEEAKRRGLRITSTLLLDSCWPYRFMS